MSSTLLLKLAGPLQSWGSSARFTRRATENAPTKSGVLGLLAASTGIERNDDRELARLAGLRFGVRIEQPGVRVRDFQTAHHQVSDTALPVSERFYLSDAVFLAAVEGDHELLVRLRAALRTPVFLPYLGRRSCPPSEPVDLPKGLKEDTGLEAVLRTEEWHASERFQRSRRHEAEVPLTMLVEPREIPEAGADTLRDQPLSFDPLHRRYGLRAVTEHTVRVPNPRTTVHDPVGHMETV